MAQRNFCYEYVMYDNTELKRKYDFFIREYRRVEPYINERRELTHDLELREEYKQKLVETYNDLIDTIDPSLLTEIEKSEILPKFTAYLIKIKTAFKTLKLDYKFEEASVFGKININLITPLNENSDYVAVLNISDTLSDKLNSTTEQVLANNLNSEESQVDSNSEHSIEQENPNMHKRKQILLQLQTV